MAATGQARSHQSARHQALVLAKEIRIRTNQAQLRVPLSARVQALPTTVGIRVPSRRLQAAGRVISRHHSHRHCHQPHRVRSSTWLILEPRVMELRMILRSTALLSNALFQTHDLHENSMLITSRGTWILSFSTMWSSRQCHILNLMQALRFYGSFNVLVAGITIVNSSQCHLKFDNCQGVMVHDVTISSPENSLNTDGIHLQNSKDVSIHHTNMACGDDCISIQTGCSNINIHNVNCGPGHGISIGGLGRDNTKACVSNVTVRDVNMLRTMNGVRIKTWQGGVGLVQDIRFSNIQVTEVQTPIIIDQFYCDKSTCRNQTSAVGVSGVQYENIRGTFTIKPVHFACSDSLPCSGISLTGVQLRPVQVPHYHLNNPFCWQAFGELYTPTVPPIACLQLGKPAGNNLQTYNDIC